MAVAVKGSSKHKMMPEAKPPKEMVMEGSPADNWEFFLKKFKIYLKANKLEDEADDYLAALFLNTVGDRVIRIYNNLEFDSLQDKNSYKKIIEKLNSYFIPTKNITYERNVFFTRDMSPNETIDEYVNELRRLSSTCEFSTLTDSLIKDRVVLGIRDRSLKDRLFKEPNLDLKKAIDICKAAELAAKHLSGLAAEPQEVSFVNKNSIRYMSFKNTAATTTIEPQNIHQNGANTNEKGYNNSKQWKCFFCGNTHEKNRASCPAKDAICNKCNKIGHYGKVCRTKGINAVHMSCTVPAAPAPPALKDLPKVAGDLKSELEGFKSSNLKHAEAQEKIVLPSAEDVAAEKTEKALIAGIEHFDTSKLKHTETQEKNPLPNKEAVLQEKTHQTLLTGVEQFDKASMRHTETAEKSVLPNKEAIEQEKGQRNLISGIENFDSTKLKHAETQEKNPLPTKETIDQEKSA